MTPTQRVQAGLSAVSDRFKQTQGQPGGIRSVAPSARAVSYTDPVERMRGKYFDNRQDVSRDRLERRLAQQQENIFNRLTMFKPVQGSSNLLQSRTPGGPSIADVYEASARKYGPTLREIGSDIAYATGKTAGAIGQKVMAGEFGLLGLAKAAYDKFSSNAAKAKDALVKGFDKLTSVEQEIAKDPNKYPKMSSHPRLQGIKDIEEYQMTELDKANTIRNNMETLSSISIPEGSSIPLTTTSRYGMPQNPPGFKVMSQLQKDLLREMNEYDMRRAQDKFKSTPGSGYQAGAGLPAIANNIQIQDGKATPITSQEFMEKEQQANEIFNDPFFNQTSNQMSGAPGFEIVTDYKSPEARMQELIEQNKVNNTNMFDLGINNAKNQLSELERVFGVDMQ